MTDPAVYRPNGTEAYDPYTKGHELDIFLKGPDGKETLGLVWPGVTVYPGMLSCFIQHPTCLCDWLNLKTGLIPRRKSGLY